MKKKRKLGKKLLSFLLTLAMLVGLMPGMGLTAYAATYDSNPYASLVNTTTTVKFNDIDWYIIKDESTAVDVGTVTLFAKEMIGGSMFHSESNAYSTSTVKSYLDGLTTEGKAFAGVADAIETVKVKGSDSDNEVDAKLWLLSTEEANSLQAVIRLCSSEEYGYWWLRSSGVDDQHGVSVCGEDAYIDNMTSKESTQGVRPALKLDLSKVTFDSTTKTFSVSSSTVNVESVTLAPSTAQTIDVGGEVSFTATVQPDNASDKKVKWSVGGTDTGAVTLYSDENCTAGNEIGTDATSTLTVYAKGISAGSATVTATSNADSEKAASCTVTVNATSLPQWTNGNVIATLDGTKLTVAKNTDTDGAMGTGWTGVGSATAWNNVRETITEIDIQSGVTSIGDGAFYKCSELTCVTIPDGVTSIGMSAISECSKLSSVTIPASVTSIGNNSFYNCSSLASVTFEPVSETEALAGNTLVLGYNPFGDTASGATVAYGTGNTVLYDGDTEITAGTALTNIGMTTLTWKARAEETFPANAIVYDFAAEAVLIYNGGAKPQNRGGNQNSGQGFYAWENDGKVDSLRNDYKGFFVADGSQLPSDCHVWRRSDRYDQDASWSDSSGLLFPNAREYAIDGLEPGSRVVFVYDAAPGNEMIWAVGDGSSANLGHPRATATINGADAVIGQTPIPSGTEVVVNSVTPAVMGTGYIVVKVKKNTVIKQIAIIPPAEAPHTHGFTYSANGATVTATCGAEGCDLTSNPTLTIVAPTLTTYGQTGEGISEKATLDGLDAFNSATDLTVAASDIKYYGVEEYEIEGHTYKKQGDELAQVPTAAGEYVAGLTLSNVKTSETETGDVIARVWYTIAPASISSVTVTDITAPVATEALDTEAATSTANVTLGAVTWNPTTTPAAYATQYTATVIATAAANYAFADTVTATVNGQAATVTKNDGGTLTIAYTFEKTALTPVTITATDKKADWSADGIAIPVEGMFTITEGAGAATYTMTNGTGEGTYDAQTGKLTVTKCGTFTVKVSTAATDTYAAGAETTAMLTVNKADSTAATVTANTLTYTGSAQALVTVTGEATGGTMQYALGTKDAATEEYTTSIPTATNAGTYYVYYKVIGDDNHEDSQPVCITVMIAPAYAVITKDPSDAKVIRGSRVTFRIAATGENVTYRWETSKDNGETWVKSNADGADTDKIVFKATESLDGRLYRCVAITDAGKVFSASAQLTTLPVISSQPRNAAATIGSVASFTVKARSSVAKYQWQISLDGGATWKKSGSEGAETATVNITVNGAKYNGYLFRCKVTNGTWIEYSKEVKLSVKTAIVKQPEDVSEYYGNLVKLYVKATGVNPQYQWQVKNASGKWVNSTSAGNNTNILAFTSRASLDGRQFRCKITDENGTVYSNIITFTAVEK